MAIQLQEFAKQVLFGTTIEEKLGFPREEIIDTRPGDPISAPRTLSRPDHLALREDGVRANHPSNAKLIDEKERGRLLHFFGNHELLATELMALALLKFPDAPQSFRLGLLETLKDEQIHTRIYMHRMRQCGVEFGELPLSDYFWRSVSSMQDPLDYVTRLSLTFEQANLDYAREYGKIFQAVGDEPTAAILDKIYRDEIDHVGFGLRWFRRWKAKGKTDWEAYRERLAFPLSPSRAKGNIFNAAGRSAAGFDKAFIKDLQIFTQSRGRTPSLWWFNPEAERYAAQNSSEGFSWGASILQNDLGFLPAYLARKDDVLILQNRPSLDFLQRIQGYGFQLPEIVTPSDGGEANPTEAPKIDRKVGDIRPWAWSPESVAFFRKTFALVTRPPEADMLWSETIRQLYSKSWSADWGRALAEEETIPDWSGPAEIYGRLVEGLAQLLEWRERFAALGYGDIVCKAPFGTAAHGIRCLMAGEELSPRLEAWLEEVWRQQGGVLVEPWLDRVFDLSVQLERREGVLRRVAFTRLVNNARGQFSGVVTGAFNQGLEPELLRFLMQRDGSGPRLYAWYEETVVSRLSAALGATTFSGPLGIDAFVYRDPAGALKLKSVVEINPRVTMGRIAHDLSARNGARSVGFFQILTKGQLRKSRTPDFITYVDALEREHPVQLEMGDKARIVSGSFALNDPRVAQRFLALYHVRSRADELPFVRR